MQDFTTVIELLEDHVRTLNYLSTPTKNVVTEHFAKENIAKAVVIHAAIDVLKNSSFPAGERKIYAWRNPSNGVVISNDKKQDLLSIGQGYPNFSEPLYTREFGRK